MSSVCVCVYMDTYKHMYFDIYLFCSMKTFPIILIEISFNFWLQAIFFLFFSPAAYNSRMWGWEDEARNNSDYEFIQIMLIEH